jgi:hypothetical protein
LVRLTGVGETRTDDRNRAGYSFTWRLATLALNR